MAMLQRLRQVPKPQEPTTVVRRMRVRIAPSTAAAREEVEKKNQAEIVAEKRKKIDEHLKSIAKIENQLDELVAEQDGHHKAIEALLRENNIQTHSNGVHKTEIAEVYSRQSIDIDPKKYRAEVPEKIFWDSISVSTMKAKEFLGEKEVMKIADVTPGKLTGHIFKIKRIERKK